MSWRIDIEEINNLEQVFLEIKSHLKAEKYKMLNAEVLSLDGVEKEIIATFLTFIERFPIDLKRPTYLDFSSLDKCILLVWEFPDYSLYINVYGNGTYSYRSVNFIDDKDISAKDITVEITLPEEIQILLRKKKWR